MANEEDAVSKKRKRKRKQKPFIDLRDYESLIIQPAKEALRFLLPDLRDRQNDFSLRFVASDRVVGGPACASELFHSKLKIMDARVNYGRAVWDLSARFVNPYEILACTGIRVLNRAFFKMWELMHIFPDLVPSIECEPTLLSAHLCEGPGGFLQAILIRRSVQMKVPSIANFQPAQSEKSIKWFAMTLATPQNDDNALKLQTDKLLNFGHAKGHVHYGADQSGDITNPDNISSFVQYVLEKCSGRRMHLVTGDGAFDVSDDFSMQEQRHCHLAFSELVTAVRLQARGGSLVLKLFDCLTETTASILGILASLYSTVEIVRLRTSRVCNSERFVVAQGFCGLGPSLEKRLMDISVDWHDAVMKGLEPGLTSTDLLPANFLEAITSSNVFIATDQIRSISKAVTVAQCLGQRLSIIHSTLQQQEILRDLRRKLKTIIKHKLNAQSLCESLGIPFSEI